MAERHQPDKSGGDQDFVGEGIHEFAEPGDYAVFTGIVTVEKVGQGGDNVENETENAAVGVVHQEERHENGRQDNARERQFVGHIHDEGEFTNINPACQMQTSGLADWLEI